jgi:hypothetical protein
MSGRFSGEQRAAYARLADILLPAAHGLPSGSEADVAGVGLDRVVRLRPDIVADLLRAIRLFEADAGLAALQADAEAWRAARLAAFSAYFLASAVMERLGYTGQGSHPIADEELPQYLSDGSLAQVIDRGPIWRSPPA